MLEQQSVKSGETEHQEGFSGPSEEDLARAAERERQRGRVTMFESYKAETVETALKIFLS